MQIFVVWMATETAGGILKSKAFSENIRSHVWNAEDAKLGAFQGYDGLRDHIRQILRAQHAGRMKCVVIERSEEELSLIHI